MSRIEVPMPQMGESIAEGTVSVWLKQVGDAVERDEAIMEISTDKVDAEIPSPAAGVLVEILVEEGTTVEVGTIVAYVDTEAAAGSGTAAAPSPAASRQEPADSPMPATDPATAPHAETDGSSAVGDREGYDPSGAAQLEPLPGTGVEETAEERLRRRSTPLVRRIAAEHGVPIDRIEGTTVRLVLEGATHLH